MFSPQRVTRFVFEQYRCRQRSRSLGKTPTLATADVIWLHFIVTKSSLVTVGSDKYVTTYHAEYVTKDAIQVITDRFPYIMGNFIINKRSKTHNSEMRNTKNNQEPHHLADELVAPLFVTAASTHYFQQSDQ